MNEEITDKHIWQIANTMYEWEGSIAGALELTDADVSAIKTRHPRELKLQRYDRIHAMIYLYYIDFVFIVRTH